MMFALRSSGGRGGLVLLALYFYSLTGWSDNESMSDVRGIPNLNVFHRGMLEAVWTGQKIPISLQTWSTRTVPKAMGIPGDRPESHDPLQGSARAHKVTPAPSLHVRLC